MPPPLILFLAIDAVWLGVVARGFYMEQIGDRIRAEPDLFAAALFYLGYAGSIVFFAVVPALNAGSWKVAARNGGLLGLTAYGAYELTNFATLPGWPRRHDPGRPDLGRPADRRHGGRRLSGGAERDSASLTVSSDRPV